MMLFWISLWGGIILAFVLLLVMPAQRIKRIK